MVYNGKPLLKWMLWGGGKFYPYFWFNTHIGQKWTSFKSPIGFVQLAKFSQIGRIVIFERHPSHNSNASTNDGMKPIPHQGSEKKSMPMCKMPIFFNPIISTCHQSGAMSQHATSQAAKSLLFMHTPGVNCFC